MDITSLLKNENVITTTVNDEIRALTYRSLYLWNEALANIKLVRAARTCVIASSKGKDSNVLLGLNLQAHLELIKENKIAKDCPFYCVTIDTDVESVFSQLTVNYHLTALKKFCKDNDINLHQIHQKPPIDKRFASLFMSGLKYYSVSRTSNDCSEILKIDTAALALKELTQLGSLPSDYCMMLGTRHDESTARSLKMKSRKNTASEVAEFNYNNPKEKKRLSVLEPISDFKDEHIWQILKHSTSCDNPLYRSPLIKPFPTYIENFSVLRLMYELSGEKSDSCPDAAAMLKGNGSAGSCGNSKSARQGCFVCLKVMSDKSANEAKRNADFYTHITGETNAYRNWLLSEAANISNRVWYARAIDFTTGYVAISPNFMNSKHYIKAIAHASILTITDRMRVKHLQYLIDTGNVSSDKGYQLIANDEKLSPSDKETLLDLYINQANQPLITLMNDQIALYISFIHSRDGVQVAPWTAYNIWKMAESCLSKAERDIEDSEYLAEYSKLNNEASHQAPARPLTMLDLPRLFEQEKDKLFKAETEIFESIPVIDISKVKFDDIPDIKMLKIPKDQSLRIAHLDSMDLERTACDYTRKAHSTLLTASEASITDSQREMLYSEKVGEIPLYSPRKAFKRNPIYASQRKIIRSKKKNNTSIIRGRSSTNSTSFKQRTEIPSSASQFNTLPLFLPSTNGIEEMNIITTNKHLTTRLAFNDCQLTEYFYNTQRPVKDTFYVNDFHCSHRNDGYEDAVILKFNEWRKNYGLYRSAGTAVYKSILSWDFIHLSDRARLNQDFIINRNELLKGIGAHDSSNEELINSAITISEHRSIKAKALLAIRKNKNHNRKYYREQRLSYHSNIERYTIDKINQRLDFGLSNLKKVVAESNVSESLLAKGVHHFDGVNISSFIQTSKSWLKLFISISVDDLIAMHSNTKDRERLNTAAFKKEVTDIVNGYRKLFNKAIAETELEVNDALQTGNYFIAQSFSLMMTLASHNGITYIENKTPALKIESHTVSLKSNLIDALEYSDVF